MADSTVKQGATCRLSITFYDLDGSTIDAANLDSVLLTLYDRESGTVINSREDVQVLDASIGKVESDGTLSLDFTTADNPIVDDEHDDGIEVHVAKLVFLYTPGTEPARTGVSEHTVNVERVFSPA